MRPAVVVIAILIVAVCMTATAGFVALTVGNYIEAKREQGRKEEFDKMIRVFEDGVDKMPNFKLRKNPPNSKDQPHEVNVNFPFGRVRSIGR